ncbi:MAG: hypothetical protein JXR76_26025 [Deltaproteobacteria bacterium]|nr:hypothetical protein [Deltaproteobacteria bacterium]
MLLAEEDGRGDQGFGGDLRYKGASTGLEGADAICQEIARRVCFGHKTWHAFLSASTVDAVDRIGDGPWYDFDGKLAADSPSDIINNSADRLPGGCCDDGTYDEMGLYHNHKVDVNGDGVGDDDDHDTLTGSTPQGRLDTSASTCDDWTSTTASGQPRIGHMWPRMGLTGFGANWASDHTAGGCAAGITLTNSGGAGGSNTVGSAGGYGAIYCFAE